MQSDNIKDNVKDIKKDVFMSDIKSFISSKIERIAVAAYKVTDFLSPDEPLKWKIRSAAAESVVVQPSQIVDPLFRLSRLFSIAKEAGIGSQMNFKVLLNECEALTEALGEEDKLVFKKEVTTPLSPRTEPKVPIYSTKLSARQIESSREEKIVTILTSMGESSIGTIAEQLPSVSEKTVQRDLITLVEKGIVNKVGERRWSRYRLAQTN